VLGVDSDVTTFSFPLTEPKVEPAPLWPSTSSVSGIYTPQDESLTYRTSTSTSPSMGISFSNFDLAAWSMNIGKQDGGG
jgi:hypothetical protein